MIAPFRDPLGRTAEKTLVDLDLVERGRLKITERRVTSAKIVERKPHPEFFKRRKHFVGFNRIAQENTLGNLKFEPVGHESGRSQCFGHDLGQQIIGKLDRRDIDRNPKLPWPS